METSATTESASTYPASSLRLVESVATTPKEKTQHPENGTYTLSELMALEIPDPEFIVDRLLSEGQNAILAGRPGIGKTLLAIQLAIHIAAGKDILGRKVKRPYKVLFVDCENGIAVIKSRLGKQLTGSQLSNSEQQLVNDNFIYTATDNGDLKFLSLSDDKGFTTLNNYIDKYKPEVVILDCLGRVFTKKETDEEQIKFFVNELEKCCKKNTSIKSILLLHHVTKMNWDDMPSLLHEPQSYINHIRGNGRLLDFIPQRMAIAEERSKVGQEDIDKHFYVVNGICRNGVSPLILRHDDESLNFEVHDDGDLIADNLYGGCSQQRAVYDYVKMYFPAGFRFGQVDELKKSNGKKMFQKATITAALQKAKGAKLLIQHPDKFYDWPK